MIRRGGWRRVAAALGALGCGVATPTAASAHGFGQRYDLPVPLSLYVTGAGAVVLLSFALVAAFMRRSGARAGYPRLDLLRGRLGAVLIHPFLLGAVKGLGLLGFGLVVLTGLFGDPRPARNLAPTLVWIVWWVGLAFLSALLGNLWTLLNPWRTAFGWAEALARRADPEARLSLGLSGPAWLGVWPALLLFLAFAWLELVSANAADPSHLATATLAYSAIVWTGMFLFGRERWLLMGEPFSLVFGLFARFAPTEIRVTDPMVCAACPLPCRDLDGECVACADCFRRAAPDRREFNLRPFAAGLLRREMLGASMTAFAVLVLATVTFDGLKETPLWAEARAGLLELLGRPTTRGLQLVETLGLVGVPLLLLAAYTLTAGIMASLIAGGTLGQMAGAFVLSLVPIAVAYHLAHYFSFLLVQGQLLIPLLSDPFGWGWNLWGTARYRIDIGIVGARFVWYWSVASIVTGHVVAVVLAHHVALRTFPAPRDALRSQLPMLVLMVAYTMLSLWIIAQPIVEAAPGA